MAGCVRVSTHAERFPVPVVIVAVVATVTIVGLGVAAVCVMLVPAFSYLQQHNPGIAVVVAAAVAQFVNDVVFVGTIVAYLIYLRLP